MHLKLESKATCADAGHLVAALLLQTASLRAAWPVTEAPLGGRPSMASEDLAGEPRTQAEKQKELELLHLGDLPHEHKTEERVRWIVDRKVPQIEWFIERIKPLYQAKEKRHRGQTQQRRHVYLYAYIPLFMPASVSIPICMLYHDACLYKCLHLSARTSLSTKRQTCTSTPTPVQVSCACNCIRV